MAKSDWGDKTRRYFWTRPEEYVAGLKAALGIVYAAPSNLILSLGGLCDLETLSASPEPKSEGFLTLKPSQQALNPSQRDL
jgi:hypothetical protein